MFTARPVGLQNPVPEFRHFAGTHPDIHEIRIVGHTGKRLQCLEVEIPVGRPFHQHENRMNGFLRTGKEDPSPGPRKKHEGMGKFRKHHVRDGYSCLDNG